MKNLFCILFLAVAAFAQAPGQPQVKRFPLLESKFRHRTAVTRNWIEVLSNSIEKLKGNPLLPDVLIYREAVRYAFAIQRIL